jgi:hypothetical protein
MIITAHYRKNTPAESMLVWWCTHTQLLTISAVLPPPIEADRRHGRKRVETQITASPEMTLEQVLGRHKRLEPPSALTQESIDSKKFSSRAAFDWSVSTRTREVVDDSYLSLQNKYVLYTTFHLITNY